MIEMTEEEIDEYLGIICERMFEAYHKLDVLLANNSDIKDDVRYPICAVLRYLLLYQEKRDAARGKRPLNAFEGCDGERVS